MPVASVGEAIQKFGRILDKLARKLNLSLAPIQEHLAVRPNEAYSKVQDWIEEVTDALAEPAAGLILIDEFQKWLSQLDQNERGIILLLFRTLMNRPVGAKLRLSVVLSGLSDLKDYQLASADFKNMFPIHLIERFPDVECGMLLRSNKTIDYDVRAVTAILELCGGNPFLINLIGHQIAVYLSELGRSYCLASDVETVVQNELRDKSSSRVWSFVQFLLRQGEEDQASMIEELPAIEALAWALRQRGTKRASMHLAELNDHLTQSGVACDHVQMERMLNQAAKQELLIKSDRGYTFGSRWVEKCLACPGTGRPRPITAAKDLDVVLNQYRKIKRLSDQGTQAEVFKASDIRYEKSQYCLKIYPRTRGAQTYAVVQSEVAALRRVNHDGVVKCIFHGVDEEHGDVLVLEWVEAPTLRKMLSDPSPSSDNLVGLNGDRHVQITFLQELALALAECHPCGVVHKDLKPENIFVTRRGGIYLPKIIDFGLASQPLPASDYQGTMMPYTENYVAPERLRGSSRRSSADIYSLGVITYELFVGERPFADGQRTGTEPRRIVPLLNRRPALGIKMAEIVESMLADEPTDRPTAAYVSAALPEAGNARDWRQLHEQAISEVVKDDYEAALELCLKASVATPQSETCTSDFARLLGDAINIAPKTPRSVECLRQLVHPVLQAVCSGIHDAGTGSSDPFVTLGPTFIDCLMNLAPVTGTEEVQSEILGHVIERLNVSEPSSRLAAMICQLMKSLKKGDLIWAKRHTLFDIAVRYRPTVPDHLTFQWGLTAAAWCRQKPEGSLAEARTWLQRVERLGGGSSPEFKIEADELHKLSKSVGSVSPPLPAKQVSPDKCIGAGERGHINVDRLIIWVQKLQRRFPFVEQVRRLEKAGGIDPRPCRLLEPDSEPKHFSKVSPKDRSRVIPAVLDESYCAGSTALRINIWLSETCTVAQRDTAMELMEADTELFGDLAG